MGTSQGDAQSEVKKMDGATTARLLEFTRGYLRGVGITTWKEGMNLRAVIRDLMGAERRIPDRLAIGYRNMSDTSRFHYAKLAISVLEDVMEEPFLMMLSILRDKGIAPPLHGAALNDRLLKNSTFLAMSCKEKLVAMAVFAQRYHFFKCGTEPGKRRTLSWGKEEVDCMLAHVVRLTTYCSRFTGMRDMDVKVWIEGEMGEGEFANSGGLFLGLSGFIAKFCRVESFVKGKAEAAARHGRIFSPDVVYNDHVKLLKPVLSRMVANARTRNEGARSQEEGGKALDDAEGAEEGAETTRRCRKASRRQSQKAPLTRAAKNRAAENEGQASVLNKFKSWKPNEKAERGVSKLTPDAVAKPSIDTSLLLSIDDAVLGGPSSTTSLPLRDSSRSLKAPVKSCNLPAKSGRKRMEVEDTEVDRGLEKTGVYEEVVSRKRGTASAGITGNGDGHRERDFKVAGGTGMRKKLKVNAVHDSGAHELQASPSKQPMVVPAVTTDTPKARVDETQVVKTIELEHEQDRPTPMQTQRPSEVYWRKESRDARSAPSPMFVGLKGKEANQVSERVAEAGNDGDEVQIASASGVEKMAEDTPKKVNVTKDDRNGSQGGKRGRRKTGGDEVSVSDMDEAEFLEITPCAFRSEGKSRGAVAASQKGMEEGPDMLQWKIVGVRVERGDVEGPGPERSAQSGRAKKVSMVTASTKTVKAERQKASRLKSPGDRTSPIQSDGSKRHGDGGATCKRTRKKVVGPKVDGGSCRSNEELLQSFRKELGKFRVNRFDLHHAQELEEARLVDLKPNKECYMFTLPRHLQGREVVGVRLPLAVREDSRFRYHISQADINDIEDDIVKTTAFLYNKKLQSPVEGSPHDKADIGCSGYMDSRAVALEKDGFSVAEGVLGVYGRVGKCVDAVLEKYIDMLENEGFADEDRFWQLIRTADDPVSAVDIASGIARDRSDPQRMEALKKLRLQTKEGLAYGVLERDQDPVVADKVYLDTFLAAFTEKMGVQDALAKLQIPLNGSIGLCVERNSDPQDAHTDFMAPYPGYTFAGLAMEDVARGKVAGVPQYGTSGEMVNLTVMFSGKQPFAIRVWPGCHSLFNMEDSEKRERLAELIPSRLVVVPPYSLLFLRGDVYHAGAGGEEMSTALSTYAPTEDRLKIQAPALFRRLKNGLWVNVRGHIKFTREGGFEYDLLWGISKVPSTTLNTKYDENMPMSQ